LPFYSDQTKEAVRAATDLLELVRAHVDLRRSGEDRYTGLCPFHQEKSPSFSVRPGKGLFYCFGCHAGGDCFRWMQLMYGMTFPQAVQELARLHGVPIPEEESARGGAREGGGRERRQLLYELMERAAAFFSSLLWDHDGLHVRNYLRRRGVGDDIIRSFRLGFSPPGWDVLCRALAREGWDEGALVEAGLAKLRDRGGVYDAFRGRLMIPVQERDGRTVAFAGRLMEGPPAGREGGAGGPAPDTQTDAFRDPPKYINSPATPIYEKGRLLYGMPQAEPFIAAAGCVFIVEGYFDLIALHSAGIRYSVAAMGTALTQTQVNMLRGKGSQVYLLFDGDRAGRDAAKKALPKLLNARLDGWAVILPVDHDPDTFLRECGAEALMELARTAPAALDYTCSRLLADRGMSLAGRAQAADDVKALLSEVPDSALGQLLLRGLADGLGIPPETLALGGGVQPEEAPPPEALPGMLTRVAPATADYRDLWEDKEGFHVLDSRAVVLFEHVLRHPATAGCLERIEGRWPRSQQASADFAAELLRQFRETGGLAVERLAFKWPNGSLGEMVTRVGCGANLPPPDPPDVAAASASYLASQYLMGVCQDRLKELHGSLRLASEADDGESSARIRSERDALQAELKELERSIADSHVSAASFPSMIM
jgi:DNA primase